MPGEHLNTDSNAQCVGQVAIISTESTNFGERRAVATPGGGVGPSSSHVVSNASSAHPVGMDGPSLIDFGLTPDIGQTPLSRNVTAEPRRVGRPTKAESLRGRGRSGSAGNFKELVKRKHAEIEQGILDNYIADSPFKRSNRTKHSPEKTVDGVDSVLMAANLDSPTKENNATQNISSSPCDRNHVKKNQNKGKAIYLQKSPEKCPETHGVSQTETPVSKVVENPMPDFAVYIMRELTAMRAENNANAEKIEHKFSEASAANAQQFNDFKKEIRAEVIKNAAIFDNALKNLEAKFAKKFSSIESKIEESSQREEIAALSERVSRLENRPATQNRGDNGETARLLKRLESQEKNMKINNPIIKGLERDDQSVFVRVESFLHDEFGVVNAVADVRELGSKSNLLVVSLHSRFIKDDIMRQKSKLGKRKVYIEHDLTTSELEIYKIIKSKAKEFREGGKKVKIAYRKLCVDGEWMHWDRSKNQMVVGRERAASAAPRESSHISSKN